MADISIKTKMQIAEKFCLSPDGCPKLKGITDYNEKLTKCAGCTNYLNKIDLVELLRDLYNTTPTTSTSSTSSTFKGKGKSTELSKAQIKEILILDSECYTHTAIANKMKIQYRTVKKVLTLGFKNDLANEKVKRIKEELRLEG